MAEFVRIRKEDFDDLMVFARRGDVPKSLLERTVSNMTSEEVSPKFEKARLMGKRIWVNMAKKDSLVKKDRLIKKYEIETGKKALWNGKETKSFKEWMKTHGI